MALTQISTAGVKDDAVTAGKIPANAVGSSELADNAVDRAAIVADAVDGTKIADDAIANEHIAADAVQTAQIDNGAVTIDKMAASSVNTAQIVANAVVTGSITDQAVTLAKLEHGTSSNNGKFLRANNGADPTFETIPPAAITAVGSTGSNRVITDDGDGTATAESSLIFDGTKLAISGSTVGNGVSLEVTSAASNSDSRHIDLVRGGSHGYIGMAGSQPNDPLFLSRSGGRDVVITTAGKVGIGIPSGSQPDDTLDVVGNMQVSANSYQSNIYLSGNLFIGGTGTANALDDYEEGTWNSTVYWQGGNTTGQSSHTTAVSGHYRKIGSLVFITLLLNPGSYNSGSDCVIVGYSLPFTPSGTAGLAMSMYGGWGNYGGWLGTGFHNYFARAAANGNGTVSVSSQTGGSGFWGHRGGYTGASGYVSGTYITA